MRASDRVFAWLSSLLLVTAAPVLAQVDSATGSSSEDATPEGVRWGQRSNRLRQCPVRSTVRPVKFSVVTCFPWSRERT